MGKMQLEKLVIQYLKKWGIIKDSSVLYIGGSEILPPPLTSEEEKNLISKLSDEKEKEMARKKLVERNLRLVVYIAKKYEKTGVSIEDIISIGTIRTYEGNKYI